MNVYPLKGKIVIFDYGVLKYRLDFRKQGILTFVGISESNRGRTDTMKYKCKKIDENIYMIVWSEPTHKDIVTQVQNFNNMTVISNIVKPDRTNLFIKGNIKFERLATPR